MSGHTFVQIDASTWFESSFQTNKHVNINTNTVIRQPMQPHLPRMLVAIRMGCCDTHTHTIVPTRLTQRLMVSWSPSNPGPPRAHCGHGAGVHVVSPSSRNFCSKRLVGHLGCKRNACLTTALEIAVSQTDTFCRGGLEMGWRRCGWSKNKLAEPSAQGRDRSR